MGKELKPRLTFAGNTAQVADLTFFLTNSHECESWKTLNVWRTLHSDSVQGLSVLSAFVCGAVLMGIFMELQKARFPKDLQVS